MPKGAVVACFFLILRMWTRITTKNLNRVFEPEGAPVSVTLSGFPIRKIDRVEVGIDEVDPRHIQGSWGTWCWVTETSTSSDVFLLQRNIFARCWETYHLFRNGLDPKGNAYTKHYADFYCIGMALGSLVLLAGAIGFFISSIFESTVGVCITFIVMAIGLLLLLANIYGRTTTRPFSQMVSGLIPRIETIDDL
ncbi:hypothetical protein Pelo_14839 [Pelomyxa schiedti]|nr:hypothetical protein Pelo_14839 [Pelomyxa schiedti]